MQKRIFETISGWTLGRTSTEELLDLLGRAAPDLDQHRQEFQRTLDELEPRQVEAGQPLLDFAFSLLDDLEHHLEDARAAVLAGDQAAVISAGDRMYRCTYQLNQAFVRFNDTALRALGPSAIPNLNHLLDLHRRYQDSPDESTMARFQAGIDGERIVTYHSLESLAEVPRLPQVESLIRALRDHMSHLNALSELLAGDRSEPSSGELMEELEGTFREISGLLPVVHMQLASAGETPYPDLNLLLKQLQALAQGDIGDAPVMEALEEIEQSFAATRDELESQLPSMESVLLRQEVDLCLETFEQLGEAFDLVYQFLEERDTELLHQGISALHEFAAALRLHQERLETLQEQQNKVACPVCGHQNERGSSRCGGCARPVPRNLGLEETVSTFSFQEGQTPQAESQGLLLTSRSVPVYKAVNAIHAGTISELEFERVLDEFEEVINQSLDRLPDEEPEDEESDRLHGLLDEGVEAVFNGLAQLRRFPASRDEFLLLEGVKTLDGGLKKVAEAASSAG